MVSILIIIMGIVTVCVTRNKDPDIGILAVFICAIIAAVIGVYEIPIMIAVIYGLFL